MCSKIRKFALQSRSGLSVNRCLWQPFRRPNTSRWVVRRKAEVVAAVDGRLLTIEEACERYDLTLEEFASWQRGVERSGMNGLRITRSQRYRDQYERLQRY